MVASVAMSPDTETKRLFVGTFLSPAQQDSLGHLAEHKAELESQWHCRVRFVKGTKLHLTWFFLGDVDVSFVPEIEAKLHLALQPIASAGKTLAINYDQVEFWPTAKRPRMIVLTPSVIPASVQEMADLVAEQLDSYVSKPGHRHYRPHITLARLERDSFAGRTIELPDWFAAKCNLPISHNIDKMELIQSELGKSSDEYKSLLCFALDEFSGH